MRSVWLALLLLCGGESQSGSELHILTWPDYFAPDTIANFEKETGCRVTVGYIESSDTLKAKLLRPPSGYDVVFPSDEAMAALIGAGVLEKLDRSKLSNFNNLSERYRGLSYDAKNEYSVPYMWGTTGIAYNKKKVNPPPDSWAALWGPKLAERVSILDDGREAFAAAFWKAGADPSKVSAEGIERAKKDLQELKVLAFESGPKDKLLSGDVWMAQCYSGDALQAAEEPDSEIAYVIPKEGGTLWVDNMCIAKGAEHADLAHRFIDYLLRAEVSAEITNATKFPNPNEAARKHVKPEILANPLIYPSDEVLKRCQLLSEPSVELKKKLYGAWAEVKGRRP